jgi:hypothetical protein
MNVIDFHSFPTPVRLPSPFILLLLAELLTDPSFRPRLYRCDQRGTSRRVDGSARGWREPQERQWGSGRPRGSVGHAGTGRGGAEIVGYSVFRGLIEVERERRGRTCTTMGYKMGVAIGF